MARREGSRPRRKSARGGAGARLIGDPLVSLLVPAFNAEATLPLVLVSIARQKFSDFECVIVDDGSRDQTAVVAQGFDARFRVISAPHGGLVAALERGRAECRGRYVARMDADDVMFRDRLGLQVDALERAPELAAVGSHVRIFPRARMTDGLRAYERWLNSLSTADDVRRDAFVECPIAHPTLCIRRDVLGDFGYRDAGWPEDYDLVLRLLEAKRAIGIVPRRLLGWRDSPARYTRTAPVCSQERIVALKAEFLARGFLATTSRYVLWGYGDTGRVLCRALALHGKKPSAIVEVHPGRIGQTIAGAPVIDPSELLRIERLPLVASVSGVTARSEIRAALSAMRFVEGRDYLCAA